MVGEGFASGGGGSGGSFDWFEFLLPRFEFEFSFDPKFPFTVVDGISLVGLVFALTLAGVAPGAGVAISTGRMSRSLWPVGEPVGCTGWPFGSTLRPC